MSGLFHAVVEATEESVYNALCQATTMSGNGTTVEALPLTRVSEILARSGIYPPSRQA
jgi:D-aminopeptidase